MRPSIRLVVLIVLAWSLILPVAATAQTPLGTPEASPAAPVCTIEPRTIEEIEALVADVEPLPDDAPHFDVIDALPTGTPADERTKAEIAAALDQYLVCAATEPQLTVLGFWSEHYIRDQAAHFPDLLDALTTSVEIVEDAPIRTLGTIDHVTALDDGRVSAIVTTDGFEDDAPIEDRTDLVILVREDGVWKLDGGYDRVASGPGGTEESIVDALAREGIASTIATPGASPAAAGCDVEPRTIEEIEALVADVEPLPDESLPPFLIESLPTGAPADKATTAEIGTALETLTACYQSEPYLTILSLHTDDYIRDLASFETTLVEILTRPEVENATAPDVFLADVRMVTLLEDGRVSAVVTLGGAEDPHPAPGRTVLMIFEEQDGVWLVDAQIEQLYRAEENETVYIANAVDIEGTPVATPEATPSG